MSAMRGIEAAPEQADAPVPRTHLYRRFAALLIGLAYHSASTLSASRNGQNGMDKVNAAETFCALDFPKILQRWNASPHSELHSWILRELGFDFVRILPY